MTLLWGEELYGGIGLGKTSYSKYPNYNAGTSIVMNVGTTNSIELAELGIEAELTHTITPIKVDPAIAFHEVKVMTFGLYGIYRYRFTDRFYARAKLGLVNYDYRWDYGTGHTHDRDDNSLSIAFGAGVGAYLTDTTRLYGDYIFVDGSDLKQFNVGVQQSF